MIALMRLMKKLAAQVSLCSRCGACQAACPLYGVTRNENDVARGKLMLLDGLMREFFQQPEGVAERLDRCLLCGSCAAACPRGVPVMEIFLTARLLMTVYKGLSPAKRLFFRKVLAHPARFDRLAVQCARWQRLIPRKTTGNPGQSALCAAPLLSAPLVDRNLVPFAREPFHQCYAKSVCPSPQDAKGPRVAVFIGCLIDKVYPAIAHAMIWVLNHHGFSVLAPQPQGCCGIPALSSGDKATFDRLADRHLSLFDPSGFDYLVTACATCTATIKTLWPMFLDVHHRSKAREIAAKTHDIHEFLARMGCLSKPETPIPLETIGITYHDACHLRKTLGVASAPRQVIAANPKYRLIEMPDANTCCGMGGGFNLAYYGLSKQIGLKKAKSIAASGASVVAAGCPACMMQLSDMLACIHYPATVVHPMEIYSETIPAIPNAAATKRGRAGDIAANGHTQPGLAS